LYSNTGYAVAAAMAEAATGESYESMLQTRLFQPLGVRAGYGWPAKEDPCQPWGHWRGRVRRRLIPQDPNGCYQLEAHLAPAGDVHLSVGDYARFLQLHLRGLHGRDGLLQAETVRQLHTPVGEYALGWGVWEQNGIKVSGHEGSAGSFYAAAVVVPECDVAVAVFANAGDEAAGDACREAATELLRRSGLPA
jgi:CubicO group peptidase (beta-lactamase class C family)